MYGECMFCLIPFRRSTILPLTMQLSAYVDYSIRVLMHAALRSPERVTVDEVAEAYGISRHHLVKVVHDLGRSGHLETHRGIGGGFTLGLPAEKIRLGDIVRLGEETEQVIACADRNNHQCRIAQVCPLKEVLDEAAAAFFAVLDACSVADLVRAPAGLRAALNF
jgi:Rrf2 family transcriptional regulator, nitric oxide-sensitive transcriptional repressor